MWCGFCNERHVLGLPPGLRRAQRAMSYWCATHQVDGEQMQLRGVRAKRQQRQELGAVWRMPVRLKNVQFGTVDLEESERFLGIGDVKAQLAQTGQSMGSIVSEHLMW